MKPEYIVILLLLVIVGILVGIMYSFKNHANDTFYNFESFVKYQPFKYNPGLPISKLKNILVFNSCSYKGNKIPEYAKLSSQINKLYCDKFGYDYKMIFHKVDEMPPYWLRVKDIQNFLATTNYEYIMYLDLDAVFHDFNCSIGQLIESSGNYDMYICQDISTIPTVNALLNTGSFIIKNTEWSKMFVKTWLNTCFNDGYSTDGICLDSWKFDEASSKWECKNCKWAGIKYEQGALANLYVNNILEARNHICIFTKDVMCNVNPDLPSFVLHLMASSDSKRKNIFENILKRMSLQRHMT